MGVIHRGNGTIANGPSWPDVPMRVYEGDGAHGATKRVLIGQRDGAENFAMRYFEVPAGQSSAHESHPHDHGVIVTRGRARVLLGAEMHDVTVGDVVYIGPDEMHRFDALGPEPLGFLCIVPAWGEKGGRFPLGDDRREQN
ncbi:MAG: cupin domain-containing protein [Chloroflexota bacterium]|nr:MAG: cupin domain-containing protein [Chloroflexota bacterium]